MAFHPALMVRLLCATAETLCIPAAERAAMDFESGTDDIPDAYRAMLVKSAGEGTPGRGHARADLVLRYVCHAVWALFVGGAVWRMEPLL